MKLGIIGDVHGKVLEYGSMVGSNKLYDFDYSVQVGDMGFGEQYKYLKKCSYDKSKHVFIPGNHDDYDNLPEFALKDFGEYELGGLKFFFIRGAESADKYSRVLHISYWPDEELNTKQMWDCLDLYSRVKPDIVISHDCPFKLYFKVLTNGLKENGSATSRFLNEIFSVHHPMQWFFGHHHKTITYEFQKTVFRCLAELETFTIAV